ncbi:MAG: hypothetical protein GXC72_14655 [Chitinophagaceae bacterium]|nr:hypothetical protein [Chitinophagaceae bacterium]
MRTQVSPRLTKPKSSAYDDRRGGSLLPAVPAHSTTQSSTSGIDARQGVVQGYFDVDQTLAQKIQAPEGSMVSDNANVVQTDQRTLYAHPSLIQKGTEVLKSKSRIVLEEGDDKEFDMGPITGDYSVLDENANKKKLKQVVPRQNPDKEDPREKQGMPSPKLGDSKTQVSKKHLQYVHTMSKLVGDFSELKDAIMELANKGEPLLTDSKLPLPFIWDWFKATQLRNDMFVSHMLIALHDYEKDRKNGAGQLDKDLHRMLHKALDILNKSSQEESSVITVNDCKQHTQSLVPNIDIRDQSVDHDPGLGGNYHNSLMTPEDDQYGWNFHFAGVVLKDGPDNVTFETAAGLSFANTDKNTWWWNMYGTKSLAQSFRSKIKKTHAKRNLALTESIPEEEKSAKTEFNANRYRFLSGMYDAFPHSVTFTIDEEKKLFKRFLDTKKKIRKSQLDEMNLMSYLVDGSKIETNEYKTESAAKIKDIALFMESTVQDGIDRIESASTYKALSDAVQYIEKSRKKNSQLLFQRLKQRSTSFSLYLRLKDGGHLNTAFSPKDLHAFQSIDQSFDIFQSVLWVKAIQSELEPG